MGTFYASTRQHRTPFTPDSTTLSSLRISRVTIRALQRSAKTRRKLDAEDPTGRKLESRLLLVQGVRLVSKLQEMSGAVLNATSSIICSIGEAISRGKL